MAGYKLKTHSGAKKRIRRTGTGKLVRRGKAGKRHLATGKARDRERRLKGLTAVAPGMTKTINRMLPYGK